MLHIGNRYYIYYILLEKNKYYLTKYKTRLVTIDDIKTSVATEGSDWLLIYNPICIFDIVEYNSRYSVKDYVIDFMIQHGLQNVRGDYLRNVVLSNKDKDEIYAKCLQNFPTYYSESEKNNIDNIDNINKIYCSPNNKINNSMFHRLYNWICCKKRKENQLLG